MIQVADCMLPHKVATVMSITQLLRRMHNAQGRHIFATCEEVGGAFFVIF